MKLTGSEAIIRCLIEEGVEIVFGYPGGAIMPAYDALFDFRSKLRHVLVRHEQGATHAAEGYARVTGRAGVCMVTSGPGATNLITGIADAMMDSIPMVCITGQVTRSVLGSDAFQETDVMSLTMPITKWNYQITSAEEVPLAMAKAFFIAENGRPGPVVIDITKNAQIETLDFNYQQVRDLPNFHAAPKLDLGAVEKAVGLISEARRPLLLVGHGVAISGAEKEVSELAEKCGIPIAVTLHGLSSVSADHPLYVGLLGMHGNYGPNVLTNEADLLIAVGMRFDDRVTGDVSRYGRKAQVIHIDIDQAEIDKNIKANVAIVADARECLGAIIERVQPKSHSDWIREFEKYASDEAQKVIRDAVHPREGGLRMSEVIRMISEKTERDAIIVADVGQNQMMAARYYEYRRTNHFITSGGLGTMGFAVPAAMGAQLAALGRQVIAVVGDGAFQMTSQELMTIVQEELPVKIVILENHFLGMVRQWQEMFFDRRYSFTLLKNPDFIKLAEAYGVPGKRITSRDDLETTVEEMLNSKGPYLLDVVVEREENVFPMVPAGASVSDIRLE